MSIEERIKKQADLQNAYMLGLEEGAQQARQREVKELATRIPSMEIEVKHIGCVKLTELIRAWDAMHLVDTGELGFCDLEAALSAAGVIVVNDVPEEASDGRGEDPQRSGCAHCKG